ncbi:PREDICTED: uncharacterized protein LOC103326553 [Prunus mume]|uniref:Uncharacterized protein LOC103326553 n=1 Tax=Prunus mume TaxID=102107 RepID=A0ABM0NMI6_PRUMU|nr:PREDICTED: uncharacterized protein LOC103326553 [Prunus mume]
MDPTLNAEATEPPAVSVAEKRPIQNGAEGELGTQFNKKPRLGPNSEKDLRRVAEIVLVLSTMAKIRGGKKPTEPEIGLMGEARSKLVELCEGLAPKDIVARDAIGAVIEDLGLNGKLKEQRLGFRGTKLTIAEKFSLTKKKMEESKKYSAQPATYPSPPLKTNFNAAAETHGMSHTVRMIPTDKPSHAPISGGFPVSSSVVHVSTVTPTSAQYQLPTNEVRASMVSSGLPSSHLGRDSSSPALPRVERAQFRSDGGPNGPSFAFQVQANSSANHPPVNAPTWSVQTQSAKSGTEYKVPNHTSIKAEGNAGMSMPQMTPVAARDQNIRPFVSQTASGNLPGVQQPLQQMHFVQAPSLPNNHNEIAKIIQKLLQPQPPEHPTWIPPSRDYMSKALTCQSCQITITEVEGVLICDACERGYHIMCAQSANQRGIPRGEWHCMRCLSLSNGKPLPPKYGRVMRSNIQVKIPSNTAGIQMSSENKLGALDPKVNQQKITANGSSAFQNPAHIGSGGSNHVESALDPKISNAKEFEQNNFPSSNKNMDERPFSGSFSSSERLSQPKDTSESSRSDERPSESKAEPPADSSNKDTDESDHSQPSSNPQVVDSAALPNCSKISNAKECQQNNFPSSNKNMDERPFSGSCSSSERLSQPKDTSESSRSDERPSESKAEPPADSSNKDTDKFDNSQPSSNPQVVDGAALPNCVEVPSKKCDDHNHALKDPDISHSGGNPDYSLRYDIKRDDQGGAQANTCESSVASGRALDHSGLSTDGLNAVQWIGDAVQVNDEKLFYCTCCVDGVMYKLQDHALFHSSLGKLIPSKLQSMWEDRKTGSKWVIVNRCYFPGDLPENVGRPSTPESNEVYESNHDSTVMAGLIQGPCEVLTPTKFSKECEKRSNLGPEANNELQPIFLCKWIYDEFKGLLQPVSQ